jgi:hypothetical protein
VLANKSKSKRSDKEKDFMAVPTLWDNRFKLAEVANIESISTRSVDNMSVAIPDAVLHSHFLQHSTSDDFSGISRK